MKKDDETDNNISSDYDGAKEYTSLTLKDGETISTPTPDINNSSHVDASIKELGLQNIAAQLAKIDTYPLLEIGRLANKLAIIDTHPLLKIGRLGNQLSKINTQHLEGISNVTTQLAKINTRTWDTQSAFKSQLDFYKKDQVVEPHSLSTFRNIGFAVTEIRIGQSYESYGAEKIREIFGDWRDFDFNKYTETTHESKSDIIKATGFDQGISETSINVLGDYMDIFGFKFEIENTNKSNFNETTTLILPSDLTHRNIASKKLTDFENKLRKFIEAIMQREVGQNWCRTHLPNGMYEKWVEKLQKYQQRYGHSKPIIEFADFTDYSLLIRNGKTFPFFQKYFKTKESILESFNRIEPARVELAHSRELTSTEYVLFCAEIIRIEKVMSS